MKKLPFIIYVTLSLNAFSQQQADHWYFGYYAGLDFSSGFPVAVTDGQLLTGEGCASLSDIDGNLLFYSDGVTIWDRTNTVMPNGTMLNSSSTCTQAALFVPYPGSDSLYYLFTPPDFVSIFFCYSIVDMTLNNGNGDITSKNIRLFHPSTEKVTAVQNANGTDVWVIGHSFYNADFYAYNITTAGIDTIPVISTSGTVQNGSINNKIGIMKASPCGDKIALVVSGYEYVELFDFENSTGMVSNAIHLDDFASNNDWGPYGLEFSPDGSRLYVTQSQPPIIVQYDLLAGSPALIIASADTVVQLAPNEYFGTLQNGPDGKTYVNRMGRHFLSCINDPNNLGPSIDFVDSAVSLGLAWGNFGLPNFMCSYFCTEVGIDNLAGGNSPLNVYPNPSCGEFSVEFDSTVPTGESSVSLFNDMGQQVYSSLEKISSSSNKIQVDLNHGTTCNISSGIYFLEVKISEVVLRKKIMITGN